MIINASGGGNKIRFLCISYVCHLGLKGGAILANEVYQRRLYIYIGQVVR